MKELLAVIPLLLSGVLAEAPYAPSGFRPNGPAFELPQKNQNPQQQYLPPVDPRIPSTKYGFPEEDVSVQGLPSVDQTPIFMVSPINGQQYVGSEFNRDIQGLDESYRQSQYQQQQEKYREFERQRQLEAAQARTRANQVPTPQVPRQFVPDTVSTTEVTTRNPDERTTESTTETNLNEGETLDDKRDDKKGKVTVEVSRQNIQEYPGELFLSGLAQLQLQPQFVPFGQIRAPLYFQPIQQEPSQKQVAGYDAATHFAALPSILAQQQYLQGIQAQGLVNPAFQQQVVVSGQDPNVGFVAQSSQGFSNQYQPTVATQNPQVFNQFQPQPFPQSAVQPQNVQPESKAEGDDEQKDDQQQPQFVYQQSYQPQEVIYQPAPQQVETQYQVQQGFQPQGFYQAPLAQAPVNQYQQGFQPQGVSQAPQQMPANQYQPQAQQNVFLQGSQAQYQPQEQPAFLPQAQLVSYQQPLIHQYQSGLTSQYQNGLVPQQFANQQIPQQIQAQDALQSGLDVNQQGNGVEQPEDEENDERNPQNDGATSVAVATAFGTRTQPRVFTRYGAPVLPPTANPQPTTESAVNEQATEDTGAVAEANAFAGRRKSAKLRSRRVRPIFTLDRSGHLVLAQEQN